jgi:hypothetical protein
MMIKRLLMIVLVVLLSLLFGTGVIAQEESTGEPSPQNAFIEWMSTLLDQNEVDAEVENLNPLAFIHQLAGNNRLRLGAESEHQISADKFAQLSAALKDTIAAWRDTSPQRAEPEHTAALDLSWLERLAQHLRALLPELETLMVNAGNRAP